MISDYDRIRYGRQIIYPDFGESGQERLGSSHVLVVGVGGLGAPHRFTWHTPVSVISR